MPRLLTLLPCEKVVVGRDNLPTLISLFEHINIGLQGNDTVEVPPETITFQRWAVFSEWEIFDHDVEIRKADQVFEMEYPDGTVAPLKGRIPFEWGEAGSVRNHQDIYGFPVGQQGWYKIRVWLEKDGKPISDIGVRRIRVIHQLPAGVKTHPIIGVSKSQ